jgi:hypothetical protein
MENGTTVLEGPGPELAGDERVKRAYLGLAPEAEADAESVTPEPESENQGTGEVSG